MTTAGRREQVPFPLQGPNRVDDAAVESVAHEERVDAAWLADEHRAGRVVVLRAASGRWLGIGRGLTTKVNANVGTSAECRDYADVLKKAGIAARAGAHTLMDLSTVGLADDLDFVGGIRAVVEETGLVVGTVPIYEATRRGMIRTRSNGVHLEGSDLLECVERQAQAGSKFMAIHLGMNQSTLAIWRKSPRNIVSKGGYITAEYMLRTGKENPFVVHFDELLKILAKYDVCLNVGSALRSGATRYNDDAMFAEMKAAGDYARAAAAVGVQSTIEGPGHVPLNMIRRVVEYQQEVTDGRPFFILGFLPTDAFTGRDHIVSAIGATEAVRYGVSWLCYITPAEHVRMPDDGDVREGVIAARIAAHVADCSNGQACAIELEEQKSDRGCLDSRARKKFCSICGQDFCPIQRLHDLSLEGEVLL